MVWSIKSSCFFRHLFRTLDEHKARIRLLLLAFFTSISLVNFLMHSTALLAQQHELPPFITPLDNAPALRCGETEPRSFKSKVEVGDILCWRTDGRSGLERNVSSKNHAMRRIKETCNLLNEIDLQENYPRLRCDSSCCERDTCLNTTDFIEKISFPLYRVYGGEGNSCLELVSCNKTFIIQYACGGCGEYTLDDLDRVFLGTAERTL